MNSLELWGGYECTVNRVGDEWFDQTPRSGHEQRIGDLQLFAGLGVRSLRYPALWERISPDSPDRRDFRWSDERLAELDRLGINPILTLCHHGSGPRYTSLIEDSFAPGLAEHAAAVAARYPWVRDYTPVNEPLTTARFSALYGLWYPHTKDERLFWVALLNEIDATRLAMREIRKVNPDARLIQTDDLGFCHATEPLQPEADFQNERRWVGWDLLCGTVVPGHKLWERIASFGLADRLRTIAADPCPPDVIGINHYLSSERLMDHRVELYPHRSVADRKVARFRGVPKIDVDAIRHRQEGVLGLPALIEQAWQRYGRTIAITECHNGATREEQVRWFMQVWEEAEELRRRGVDLCAVTAWALLGSHDWNRMVTRFVGHYETGVFDVRTGTPRPTLLASVLTSLAAGQTPSVPEVAGPGWWRRESRLIHAAPRSGPEYDIALAPPGAAYARPLAIVGGEGELGRLVARACEMRGLWYARGGGDASWLRRTKPWAVVDARDPDAVCGIGKPGIGCSRSVDLQTVCIAEGIPLAHISGAKSRRSTGDGPGALEVRTGSLFVPWDRSARAVEILDALDAGRRIEIDAGAMWSGAYGPDVVDVTLDLLLDGMTGNVDVNPAAGVTELQFARALAEVADRNAGLIVERGRPPSPPLFGWTDSAFYLPPLETGLERFVREARAARLLGVAGVERREDDVRLEAA
ncbi:MAG TPA: family 1 glycosylhydrolase [Sphingomonadaceae bacterium]|nr:family 1 glycosylhydrolase [Sphingomonadaceae bacterium]